MSLYTDKLDRIFSKYILTKYGKSPWGLLMPLRQPSTRDMINSYIKLTNLPETDTMVSLKEELSTIFGGEPSDHPFNLYNDFS